MADLRESLWSEIDMLVRQHRAFASADWALPPEEVDRLADIADRLKPTDAVTAQRWLFDTHLPDLGAKERAPASERLEDVAAARAEAIQDLFHAGGLEAVLRLARSVKFPRFVGTALASCGDAELDAQVMALLDEGDHQSVALAQSYGARRAQSLGWEWVVERLKPLAGHPLAQARLLLVSDELAHAWRSAGELGEDVERAYWSEFAITGRGGDFALVEATARNLLKHGRVVAALDLLSMYSQEDGSGQGPAELILEALEQLLASPPKPEDLERLSSYELNVLLDRVRNSSVDEDRLGLLEWRLLPALGFEANSPVLHRRLARDPEFFVEILSLLFRRRSEDTDSEGTPEHVARNAWHLLHDWRIVPGSSEPMGTLDEGELVDWIRRTRDLLEEADRLEVGEVYIGHVLAQARSDEDGTWPTRPVRNAIEQFASPNIDDGFRTQTYNNRGVTSRNPMDGGNQERALAAKYSGFARSVRDEWPRTAALLSNLAAGYEAEARLHDEEAERMRQGMDR